MNVILNPPIFKKLNNLWLLKLNFTTLRNPSAFFLRSCSGCPEIWSLWSLKTIVLCSVLFSSYILQNYVRNMKDVIFVLMSIPTEGRNCPTSYSQILNYLWCLHSALNPERNFKEWEQCFLTDYTEQRFVNTFSLKILYFLEEMDPSTGLWRGKLLWKTIVWIWCFFLFWFTQCLWEHLFLQWQVNTQETFNHKYTLCLQSPKPLCNLKHLLQSGLQDTPSSNFN